MQNIISFSTTYPYGHQRHKIVINAFRHLLRLFNTLLSKTGLNVKIKPEFFFYGILVFYVLSALSCKKELVSPNFDNDNSNTREEAIFWDKTITRKPNPKLYLATLNFDGNDNFDNGERNFPQSYIFNSTQDPNNDGSIDIEDNLENLIRYSIGNNLTGTGRTGLSGRGPNDQRPAIYFHRATAGIYDVYEYWLYYADNDWLNDHEHDWEKYFVYVQGKIPQFIKISNHNSFVTYNWSSIPKDNNHPSISVDGGSHAMKVTGEDGVTIRFTGQIVENNGILQNGYGQTIPWVIYSNDANVSGVVPFTQYPDVFNYGDPEYSTNSDEYGSPNDAPWMRMEWNNPPMP